MFRAWITLQFSLLSPCNRYEIAIMLGADETSSHHKYIFLEGYYYFSKQDSSEFHHNTQFACFCIRELFIFEYNRYRIFVVVKLIYSYLKNWRLFLFIFIPPLILSHLFPDITADNILSSSLMAYFLSWD